MTKIAPKKRQIAANWTDIELEYAHGASAPLDEGLPRSLIESAFTVGALPKFENDSGNLLVLLRIFDGAADRRAAGTRELTRRLALFIKADTLITAHRFSTTEFPAFFSSTPPDLDSILNSLLDHTIQSYTDALNSSEEQFELLEASVFQALKSKPFRLRDAYYEKRRLNVIRKMLKLHLELFDSLQVFTGTEKSLPHLKKGLKKKAIQALSNCEALLEGMNHLLQLQLSLVSQKTNEASQKTNEVMRILTVFSAFFLPLTFIVGIYGMNFENMPELKHPLGYVGVLTLMAGISLFIFIWFRKRGWIGKSSNPG